MERGVLHRNLQRQIFQVIYNKLTWHLMHICGRRWEYDVPSELSGGTRVIWPVDNQKQQPVLLALSGCSDPKSSSAWVTHTQLPELGALGLVGHTLGWDPLPRLLTLLPGGEPVWNALSALRSSGMSGKGSGPVSTFSFRDLPLLGFLVCLGFF